MTKATKIIPPEGYEVDKKKSTFEEIVFKKSKLPEKWEELETIHGYLINSHGYINGVTSYKLDSVDRGIYSSRALAEASIAVAQLSQLREVTRDGWEPDWESDTQSKYTLQYYDNRISLVITYHACYFLTFQSEEVAVEFLNKYIDLIEQARPILGG